MKKIDHVYISSYKADVRLLRPCVASIRTWYPDIPITVIQDFHGGAYSVNEACNAWNLNVFETDVKRFGSGWSRLELYFREKQERFLYLDADIVFTGRVIDELEQHDEDLVLSGRETRRELMAKYWFDLEQLAVFDPDFAYPGEAFNAGLFVAETGALTREDFVPILKFDEPRRSLYPEMLLVNDSGPLNYVWLKKRQAGELSIGTCDVMRFCPSSKLPRMDLNAVREGIAPAYALHWAGRRKRLPFDQLANGHILQYFEDRYYDRVPLGTAKQALRHVRERVNWSAERLKKKVA